MDEQFNGSKCAWREYGTRFEKLFGHNFHQISDCNDEIKTILTLDIIIYDPYVIEYSITCAVPLSESQEIVLKNGLTTKNSETKNYEINIF